MELERRRRRDWNKLMKIYNGNIPNWINVCYQNVPLGVSTENKEKVIETIMTHHHPHVLGLAEPRRSELELMSFPGYWLHIGIRYGYWNT